MRNPEHQTASVDKIVEEYAASLVPRPDPVLLDLEKDAERRSVPIIGPTVGSVISLILKSASAQQALEVGTATGYSAIWIARSLQGERKKLTTIELDPQRVKEARANFGKAGVDEYVELVAGDGRSLVPEIAKKNPEFFDLVFLDVGDKTVYLDLLDHCIDALRVGGFLVADNTLFGAVADPEDKTARIWAIRKFNELVFSEKKLDAALIPLRTADSPPYGFTVAYKKGE
jgi:predicted O-methyltransferase YrrM